MNTTFSLHQTKSRKRYWIGLLLIVWLSPMLASANENVLQHVAIKASVSERQSEKQRTGTVRDEAGESLPGVSIVIKGTTMGTITDFDGKYTINTEDDAVLVFSFIGFESSEVAVNGQAIIDVVLKTKTELLDELVVTALGIKKSEKVLGYTMQQVKSDELTESGNPNVLSALEGKVAGVEITTSATGLGGSNKISIRGNSSISGNNDPLWVVDGIPFTNNGNSGPGSWGGYDRGSTGVDINPDDIESISVLKGQAASALYGSLAGNGVIMVTTKRGASGDKLGVDFSAKVTVDDIYGSLDMQDKYGRGNLGEANSISPTSWGSQMDGHLARNWKGDSIAYSPQTNRLNEFFRTGVTQLYNVSLGKGDKERNYRLGSSYANTKGIFPNQGLKRLNVDVSGGTKLNSIFSVESKLSLTETQTDNRIYYGAYGAVNQLLQMPRNIRMEDLKEYSSAERQHINWTGGAPSIDLRNPYYVAEQYNNTEVRNRVFGYGMLKAEFNSLLKFSVKQSIDLYSNDFTNKVKDEGLTPKGTEGSSYSVEKSNYKQLNTEFMLTGQKMMEALKLDVSYIAGANRMWWSEDGISASANNLLNSDFNLGAGKKPGVPFQWLNEKEIQSVFGSLQFYYNSILNLEITSRNDWSSALPIDNCSYFYPSANLGFIGSTLLDQYGLKPYWLSFGKVRLSWAKVGKDMAPHQLENIMKYKKDPQGNIIIDPDSEIKRNSELKPEISTARELGLDLRFFESRLGFDFTYYNSSTINQILLVDNIKSSGYKYKYINAGKIKNSGIELALDATPVKTDDFSFDVNLNFAERNDFVESLDPENPKNFQILGENDMIKVIAQSGKPLGQIVAKRSFLRDAQGRLIIDQFTGLPKDGGQKVIGNIQPDFTGSLRTSLSYKNLSFTALFNFKKGGDIVSVSESVATYAGTSKLTENREDILVDGVIVDENGSFVKNNDIKVSAQKYYQAIGAMGNGVAEAFLYDASYIKIGEMSLSYSLAKKQLGKLPFNNLRFAVTGRNLVYLFQNTPGTIPDGGFDMFSQAHDFSSVPNTRNIGFSINATF